MAGVRLAVETAFPAISVALEWAGEVLRPRIDLSARRATALHPAIEDLLAQAGRVARDIDDVLVDVGPGSYTGLRVGLGLVLSLRELVGCDVHRLHSTDLIAWRGRQHLPDDGEVVVSLDARRQQWFFARYRREGDGRIEKVRGPECLTVEALRESARGATCVLTAGDEPPLELPLHVVGVPDAASMFALDHLAVRDVAPEPVYLMPPV